MSTLEGECVCLPNQDFTKEERAALASKSRGAPPHFGSPERQRVTDEVHAAMLAAELAPTAPDTCAEARAAAAQAAAGRSAGSSPSKGLSEDAGSGAGPGAEQQEPPAAAPTAVPPPVQVSSSGLKSRGHVWYLCSRVKGMHAVQLLALRPSILPAACAEP